ncbi:MAG: hypothetical protein ACOX3R_00050 [Desulfitobacteriia bacterium]|jgi:hydrogenase small subunit
MRLPVIWMGTNTCAGDLLSFLNAYDPGYQSFITDLVDFRYDYLLGAAQGDQSTGILEAALTELAGQYILIVEGTIPTLFEGMCSVIGYPWGIIVLAH